MSNKYPDALSEACRKISKEPNFQSFSYKGYNCAIQRMCYAHAFFGSLNGYVFVPKEHKLYGKTTSWDEKENPIMDMNVHGGITWASESEELFPDIKDMWVFGFDCGHAFDMQPYYQIWFRAMHNAPISSLDATMGEYRDWEYVTQEIHNLVDQIKEKCE